MVLAEPQNEIFKQKTRKAVWSIVLFIFSYLLLIALSLVLTIASVYLGFRLIAFVPSFLSILLGISIASIGVLISVFLFKFFFYITKADYSNLIEITKEEQPRIFRLIDELVVEIGTESPKKVYLTTDVNAAVFYNSSFWSMFFPVRKNLVIGLGLINTLSVDELKAVLAHEFGHFSQRSMRVGSYVYQVNRVLYNLLFENTSYSNLMQKWASISQITHFFVVITVEIIKGIQWILRKMYEFVNSNYMELSQEMEFHADEIAAKTVGSVSLKTALLRSNFAEHTFNATLSYYDRNIVKNTKTDNVYPKHFFVLNFYAKEEKYAIENNLPQLSLAILNKYNKSKLFIKDQWASHPSTEDRVLRLEQLNIPNKSNNTALASTLFDRIDYYQTKATAIMFRSVVYKESPIDQSTAIFERDFEKEFFANSFDRSYNGYYDNRSPLAFDLMQIDPLATDVNNEDLFSPSKVEFADMCVVLKNDIDFISKIARNEFEVKSFDYDGKRYAQKDSLELAEKLKKELAEQEHVLLAHDKIIFSFYYALEPKTGNESRLMQLYKELFDFEKNTQEKTAFLTRIHSDLQFIHFQTPNDIIREHFSRFQIEESKLKKHIRELLSIERNTKDLDIDKRENFEKYLVADLIYFSYEKYNEPNLQILFKAIDDAFTTTIRGHFLLKLELLNYQKSLDLN